MNVNSPEKTSVVMRVSVAFFLIANFIWLGLPVGMAVIWSMVDPAHPWSFPDIFPDSLSFTRWVNMWQTTSLPDAMFNSYSIALTVAPLSLLLALPTAYAFGRIPFRGKGIAEILTLIPLVMPGMLIGIFFSAMILQLDIENPFISIVTGHTVLALPYAIRILSAGFRAVPQEMIDASRDLGSDRWATFRNAYLPFLKSAILATLILCFVRSLEEFSVSYVLGSPDFITIPTILYSFLGYTFVRPDAAVVSMILIIPNIFLMIIIKRALKDNYAAESTGKY
ncbi:ABC transporter permease [Pantoea sp. Bo_2]|uniref:ABC transporter permease n=1 Tax=unclassified Pantoea TaxID=2630326 RepID=UPI001231FF31|nr:MULTISPECIES: ABC transporter permease [unclassified Pantoea]KAA5939303.1 ABC transporter permease [Pantoea sp. VH_3]KAA5948182.1 ABC transporter permease [Pantoea sp. VH_25]KAA5977950.1 ABC transporter permease [Pantoea sp. M_3]KAA6041579.1 ABC transporter permease [Pantoea sp. FN_2b]KAA6046381.1 ABC transporter permease [Pantoea sp. Bo_5]